jgi:hypothetical protein
MAVSTTYKYKVRPALMQFAKTGLFPYYSECGFGTYGPGKDVLDEISGEETRNGRPDITFVLRSKTTGYPSQIGLKSAKAPDDTRKVQARAEAQRLKAACATLHNPLRDGAMCCSAAPQRTDREMLEWTGTGCRRAPSSR